MSGPLLTVVLNSPSIRDLRFRELVRNLLADHPAHLDGASLAYFMHAFSETDKLSYQGESQDGMSVAVGASCEN